jgi:hypothetical protein
MLIAISFIVIAFISIPAGHFIKEVSSSGFWLFICSISLLNLFLLETIERYNGLFLRNRI